jgi:hypothetical protein
MKRILCLIIVLIVFAVPVVALEEYENIEIDESIEDECCIEDAPEEENGEENTRIEILLLIVIFLLGGLLVCQFMKR